MVIRVQGLIIELLDSIKVYVKICCVWIKRSMLAFFETDSSVGKFRFLNVNFFYNTLEK